MASNKLFEQYKAPASTCAPSHRESIVLSRLGPAPAEAEGAETNRRNSACGRVIHNPDQLRYMNKWGVEPPGDVRTCCMGAWLPCILYSKVKWRLDELELDEKDRGKEENGFNNCNKTSGVFFSLGLLNCIIPGLGLVVQGIATGFQRGRVRGTYGALAEGSVINDVALGIFCGPCTLIQNDRECRARAGEERLQNNPDFEPCEATDCKPELAPEMRAVIMDNPAEENQPPGMYQELATYAGPSAVSASPRQHSKVPNGSDQAGQHNLTDCEPISEMSPTVTQNALDGCNAPLSQTQILQEDENNPRSTSANLLEAQIRLINSYHDLANCVAVNKPAQPTLHELEQCTKSQTDNYEEAQHKLENCPRSQIGIEAVQQHNLDKCTKSGANNVEVVQQHELDKCAETVMNNAGNPVQQKHLGKSTNSENDNLAGKRTLGTRATTPQASHEIREHRTLSESTSSTGGIEVGSLILYTPIPGKKYRSVSTTVEPPNRTQSSYQHRLSSCPTPIATHFTSSRTSSLGTIISNGSMQEHDEEGGLNVSTTSPSYIPRPIEQYRRASGTIESTQKDKNQQMSQHRLSSCPTPIAMVRSSSGIKEESTTEDEGKAPDDDGAKTSLLPLRCPIGLDGATLDEATEEGATREGATEEGEENITEETVTLLDAGRAKAGTPEWIELFFRRAAQAGVSARRSRGSASKAAMGASGD